MRVAVLCDIGQETYHVGDEAIAHGTVHQLTARGVDVMLLTRDVEDTRRRFGDRVACTRTLLFPWLPVDRQRYLGEIKDVCAGRRDALPAHDQVFALIEALRGVDAVLIGGGGNLNSSYGWLLYERAAVAWIGRSLGKPVMVSGQTLGPELSPPDRRVLAELLNGCVAVGLREETSLRLASELCPDHPGLSGCYDDATVLPDVLPQGDDAPSGGLMVTLAAGCGPFNAEECAEPFARALDRLASEAGHVTLVPHMARAGMDAEPAELVGGDVWMHRMVAEAMASPVTELPLLGALEAATITRNADVVLSTRYHPAIFVMAGGAATIPVTVDHYSAVRIGGALRTWGLDAQPLPIEAVYAAGVHPARLETLARWFEQSWGTAERQRAALQARREQVLAHVDAWWDFVVAVLASGRLARAAPAMPNFESVDLAVPGWLPAQEGLIPGPTPQGRQARVAVVMRTKDRGLLLRRGIDDVLAQTYPDWHLVIVNDGGDPAPVDRAVAERADALMGRVTVVHNSVCLGMETAANIGLDAYESEFVCLHDDDDTWQSSFLMRMVDHLDGPGKDQIGVLGRVEIWLERQDGEEFEVLDRIPYWLQLHELTLLDLIKINRTVPIAFCYRRTLHDSVGRYDDELPVVGDWTFLMRVLSKHRLGFLEPQALAHWRQRPGAVGAAGNSVIAKSAEHDHYDVLVRERALKEWVDRNGLGLPLFINKITEREIDRVAPATDETLHIVRDLRGQVGHLHGRIDHLQGCVDGLKGRMEQLQRRVDDQHDMIARLLELTELTAGSSLTGALKRRYQSIRER